VGDGHTQAYEMGRPGHTLDPSVHSILIETEHKVWLGLGFRV